MVLLDDSGVALDEVLGIILPNLCKKLPLLTVKVRFPPFSSPTICRRLHYDKLDRYGNRAAENGNIDEYLENVEGATIFFPGDGSAFQHHMTYMLRLELAVHQISNPEKAKNCEAKQVSRW